MRIINWFADFYPSILVVGGSLVAALGVLLGDVERARSAEKVAAQSDKIAAQSDKIASLSQEIINLTTGESSYASVVLDPIQDEAYDCPLALRQFGDYTVHDVYIHIVDLTLRYYLMRTYSRQQITDVVGEDPSVVISMAVGNMSPGDIRWLPTLDLTLKKKFFDADGIAENQDKRDFGVRITGAKDGMVKQQFHFRRSGGVWQVATKREQAGRIHEEIPPKFRDAKGMFEWVAF